MLRRVLKDMILQFRELLANSPDCLCALACSTSCLCCVFLRTAGCSIFPADGSFLLPAGDGIGKLFRVLCHPLLIQCFHVCDVRFIHQLLCLVTGLQLFAVRCMFHGMHSTFRHTGSGVCRLHGYIVILILRGNLSMHGSRYELRSPSETIAPAGSFAGRGSLVFKG